MSELRLPREIRWRGLVISRGVSEDEGYGLGVGSVIASESQDSVSNSLSYADSLRLIRSLRDSGQHPQKLGVELPLEGWIECYEDFMGRDRGCCIL